MIENWAFFVRFLLTTGCFCVYVFFLTPKQLKEAVRPSDWLTGLRYLILGILVLTVVTFIPSIIYLLFLALGQELGTLRQVSSVVGGINLVGTTTLMVLIFTYRKRS